MKRLVVALLGGVTLGWALLTIWLVVMLWEWATPRDRAETLLLGLAPLIVFGGFAFIRRRSTRAARE
jgi:hypothetical protein